MSVFIEQKTKHESACLLQKDLVYFLERMCVDTVSIFPFSVLKLPFLRTCRHLRADISLWELNAQFSVSIRLDDNSVGYLLYHHKCLRKNLNRRRHTENIFFSRQTNIWKL